MSALGSAVRMLGAGLSAGGRGMGGDGGTALGVIGALASLGADIIDGGSDPVVELQRVRERLPARSKAAAKIQESLRAKYGASAESVYGE